MKMNYESPEFEIICFTLGEILLYVSKDEVIATTGFTEPAPDLDDEGL